MLCIITKTPISSLHDLFDFFFGCYNIRHQSRSTDLFCYDRLSTSILHTLFLIFYYFKRYIYWIRVFEFVYLTLVNLLSLSFHSLEKVELRTLLLFTFTYLFICFFPWFNHFLFSMPRSPYLPTLFTFPIRKQFFFVFFYELMDLIHNLTFLHITLIVIFIGYRFLTRHCCFSYCKFIS